jgi:hypothetical protein
MKNKQINLFIADIKYIVRFPALLFALLSPVFILLFLIYGFPLVSGFTRVENTFLYDRYFTITAITLISAIPFIYGLLFSFIQLAESQVSATNDPLAGGDLKWHFKLRIVISVILSFGLILLLIYLTDAVPTEGWLRSIYAAFLFSVMTSLVFLFSICFAEDVKRRNLVFLISVLFLMTVPSGLMLHHPWNYFIFFSPFYWLGWAWIITSPAESLLYGLISVVIAGCGILILCRYLAGRAKTG